MSLTLGKTKKNGHPERSRRTDYILFSTIELVFDYVQTHNICAYVNDIEGWGYCEAEGCFLSQEH